jgi:O-antigen ligase
MVMKKIREIRKSFTNNSYHASRDRICANVIDFGLLSLLIFTPLPAASVYEWSVLLIQMTVLVMMGAYLLMKEKPQNNEFLSLASKWPKVLFFGFSTFVLVQIFPLPKFLIKILSPSACNYLRLYTIDFEKMQFMSFSLIPSYTIERGLELLSYLLLGFLVLKTVTKRRQILRIFSVLIAVGVFEAFYGLFELYNKTPRILFYKKIYNLDSVTGTFVNRNHLSGYLEMIMPLAIGLIIARIDLFSSSSLTWRKKLLRFSEKGLSTNFLLFLGVVLMAIAIIYSKSRSGVFIMVFTFILFFGLTAIYFEIYKLRKERIKNFLMVAFLLTVFISLYVGIDAMLDRFSLDKLLHEGRPTYWAHTMRTFSDFPLFGTGLGTFGALYPNLEGEAGPFSIVHAHNDYLEYLSELGLIGFALLLGGIIFVAVISFLSWSSRKHPGVKGLALGGIVSIICILIHSITDFNLHIPANMVLFSVILPLTMVTAFYKRSSTPPEKE